MKKFVIQKKIDKLGRIVLPKELRDFYGMGLEEIVEIMPSKNGILICKRQDNKEQ